MAPSVLKWEHFDALRYDPVPPPNESSRIQHGRANHGSQDAP